MEHKIIKKGSDNAIVIQVERETKLDVLTIKNLVNDANVKKVRVYYWIDDVRGSLPYVLPKFECLFAEYGLKNERYNEGRIFAIDSVTCADTIIPENPAMEAGKPRSGEDDGVVDFS